MKEFKRWLVNRGHVTPADVSWITGLGCDYNFKHHTANVETYNRTYQYVTKTDFTIVTTTQKQVDMLMLHFGSDMHLLSRVILAENQYMHDQYGVIYNAAS